MAQLVLTATNARASLRRQLRDASSTLWTDSDLNECCHEGLRAVFAFYPRPMMTIVTITADGERLARLQPGTTRVLGVYRPDPTPTTASLDVGVELVPVLGWSTARGVQNASGDLNSAADPYELSLVLPEDAGLLVGDQLYVFFEGQSHTFGGVSTDVDTAGDIGPTMLATDGYDDSLPREFFYAVCREAAYRMQMQAVQTAGAEAFEKLYGAAIDRRRELQALLPQPPLMLRVENGLF